MKKATRLKLFKKKLNCYKARQLRLLCAIKAKMGYHSVELSTLERAGLRVDEKGYVTNFDSWSMTKYYMLPSERMHR